MNIIVVVVNAAIALALIGAVDWADLIETAVKALTR